MITTQISLAKSLRLDWHCRRRQRTMGRTNRSEQNPERSGALIYTVGWWAGDQVVASSLRSRQKFCLDIPFYRAHWQSGVLSANGRIIHRGVWARLVGAARAGKAVQGRRPGCIRLHSSSALPL